ncbi:hypothetical protein HanRHA438_Chr09g0408431 [Helianthus annuus]|nr:hypothetical protein HanRHA438_Chr09g0408431 [Helianthus annuus]
MSGSSIFSGGAIGFFCQKYILIFFKGCVRPPWTSPRSAPASNLDSQPFRENGSSFMYSLFFVSWISITTLLKMMKIRLQ